MLRRGKMFWRFDRFVTEQEIKQQSIAPLKFEEFLLVPTYHGRRVTKIIIAACLPK